MRTDIDETKLSNIGGSVFKNLETTRDFIRQTDTGEAKTTSIGENMVDNVEMTKTFIEKYHNGFEQLIDDLGVRGLDIGIIATWPENDRSSSRRADMLDTK